MFSQGLYCLHSSLRSGIRKRANDRWLLLGILIITPRPAKSIKIIIRMSQETKPAIEVNSKRSIPSLDGLRAISIAIVVLSHIPYGGVTNPDRFFFGLIQGSGNVGVRIFFVISGFLITSLLINEHEQENRINLARFYFRRSLRIFLPYYAYLAICLVLAYFGFIAKQHATTFYSSLPYAAMYIVNYKRKLGLVVGHVWSLSVEEQFYLLWPGIVALFGILKCRRFAVAAILLCPLIRLVLIAIFHSKTDGGYVIGFTFETTCDALATGCLLALTASAICKSRFYSWIMSTKVFAAIVIGMAAIQILSVFTYGYPFIFYNTIGVALLNVGIAICILKWVSQPLTLAGKLLNYGPVMFVGQVSYSIYLWQNIFMFNAFESKLTAFPFSILWVAGAALASFYFIENPCFAIRHYLDQRIFKQRKMKALAAQATR